jgi:ATP-binding cassette subfamily B protein
MNYKLNQPAGDGSEKNVLLNAFKKLAPLMKDEKRNFILSLIAIVVNSALNLVAPLIIAYTIDTYIVTKQYHGVLIYSGLLFAVYIGALISSYIQTKLMGGVGQRVLFNLRNAVFNKLQELPVAFFNQNKAGDLISRINNDTDKLNQFFSQAFVRFVGSLFIMAGAAIFLLSINWELGLASLAPTLGILIFTQIASAWVKRKNAGSLKALGGMSAEVQESLNNFKVIVAFNRRDYFRERFAQANEENYKNAVGAGLANTVFTPVYTFFSTIAQLIVLAYGIFLIIHGQFAIGLLIGYLAYVTNFYNPLQQIAALWASLQVALAGWDRISQILSLHSDLAVIKDDGAAKNINDAPLLEFKDIHFGYPDGKEVLRGINFTLERGKTYAFVGPTGGGKTTTASIMARLYDPTSGTVFLNGRDIRSYESAERTKKIGFILQEPFLFTGTIRDNIVYGNEEYLHYTSEQLREELARSGLEKLLERFESGLDTVITSSGDGISLGQKQLIAFIRAVLRKPELLILDEATANIDTVTEQLLSEILEKLPKETTQVVIAHRLNTIENADEIFFVNAGEVVPAGSLDHAIEMLMHGKRQS